MNKTRSSSFDEWGKSLYKFPESRQPSTSTSQDIHTAPPQSGHVLTRHGFTSLQTELQRTAEQFTNSNNECDSLTAKLESVKTALKRTTSRESYYRSKVAKLEQCTSDEKLNMISDELDKAQMKVLELKQNEVIMTEAIKQNEECIKRLQNTVFETYDHGSFNTKFRQIVYQFSEHHVGTEHISPVIKAVLDYVGLEVSLLPSSKTIQNMNIVSKTTW